MPSGASVRRRANSRGASLNVSHPNVEMKVADAFPHLLQQAIERERRLAGFAGSVSTGHILTHDFLTHDSQVIYAKGIFQEYCVLVRRHGVQLDVIFDV